MRRWLPELVALPLLPLLLAQGRRARRLTPRMPEAAGPNEGIAGDTLDGDMLSLLAVGESPVAGVGVATYAEAVTAQLAQTLSTQLLRPVRWRARGINGITVREALQRVVPHIPMSPVDLVLVAFGVNDTTAFRRTSTWRRDLMELLQVIDSRCAPRLIILSGVPPLAHFPALPEPLRWVMGMKARALDGVARELASAMPRVVHVPLMLDPQDHGMMAADGYHPSASGCAAWAQTLAAVYDAPPADSGRGI